MTANALSTLHNAFRVIKRQHSRRWMTANALSILRNAFCVIKRQHPFHIDAIVILPEHLHCILTLPESDDDFSDRWRAIKKIFSKKLTVTEYRSKVRRQRHERGRMKS